MNIKPICWQNWGINMPSIAQTLNQSDKKSLTAEILLAHVLGVQRSYLHAFPERELIPAEKKAWDQLMEKYLQGMPVAYLTGHAEFWSLDLEVTQDTLIPRHETELLVECILEKRNSSIHHVADLGTGSGAIALALAHENPPWVLHATDISPGALAVAKNNANRLKLNNIHFYQGDWYNALPKTLFDIIVSNPPYIAKDDPYLENTVLQYEPSKALIAEEEGLKDLEHIINAAPDYLSPDGWLFLEHGFQQAERVRRFFIKAGYNDVLTYQDLAGLERVTCGQLLFDLR
jgi:release factor glutamine methyltransferase